MSLSAATRAALTNALGLGGYGEANEVIGVLNGTFLGTVTLPDAANIVVGTTTGTKVGTAATQMLGFFGATPVSQPTSANEAAVATTAPTNTSPYGYTTSAQAAAIVTLVNQLRSDLVSLGLIKGS